MKYVSVVGLPHYTLARHSGMGSAPGALRRAGLLSALGGSVLDEGDVVLPHLEHDVLEGGAKNLSHFRNATAAIHESLRGLKSDRTVLLGGDCSVAVGGLSGLSEAFGGKPSMLWMDAHGDFNVPESSPSSYIGGMCLAMACGRGPPLGAAVDARRPLLDEQRLVHLGSRALDLPEVKSFESSPAMLLSAGELRKRGAKKVGAEVSKRLADAGDWIACHLDIDVVDPDSILAVNYPSPGGLKPSEVSAVMAALASTGKLRMVDVAAYNPSLDDGGSSAAAVVSLLKESFQG